MLHLAILFLLPAFVFADLKADQEAAFCAIKCLPTAPAPKVTDDKTCLHLVHNSTASQGDGLWAYDRLVFEGPDCGVYTFVIRTAIDITMMPVTSQIKNFETKEMVDMPARNITCLRACGGGLLEPECAAPKLTSSHGWVNYKEGPQDVRDRGQTVYRAVHFGCEKKTTIIRVYRSEFEIRADLGGERSKSYGEVWSINRGFLQTSPYQENVNSVIIPFDDVPVVEVSTDKNVCALKCFGYKDPTPSAPMTCNRTLINATSTAKSGKWSYDREVYEGPECDVYTFVITTKSDVSMSIDSGSKAEHQTEFNTTNIATENCVRSCGFAVCDKPIFGNSTGALVLEEGESASAPRAYNHAQFECEGVKTVIVRSFRPETVVRIDLEREESPTSKFNSEKWRIKDKQLVTETLPYVQ